MGKTRKSATSASRAAAKAASREALIEAATELYPKHGLDVSLDEICAHAGYTRGAFYVHFQTRDELTLEVMTRLGKRFMNALFGDAESKRVAGMSELFEHFFGQLFSGEYPMTRHGGLRPYQLLDACVRSPDVHRGYLALVDECIGRLAVYVREDQERGRVRNDLDAEVIAKITIALVIGVHTLYDLDFSIDFAEAVPALLGVRS
ncbi:MAG: TetR/AcrR family transcriptional regulator; helix-turn-helix transcriptional regulator [Actinomycetia bacterium]|nr:TetR/AcrR family transcriptional regulator; helix-turn-helix transcriptional regulator [Actinomycetes bacterium]MCH9766766.1 TetR/AcrR family transcriptional regulator; helix-turn-helix transcriptional regulator [Actinomycetes bacterium]